MRLTTIFFCEYPKKEKDINKKMISFEFIGSLVVLIAGIFILTVSGIWWFSILFFLGCLVISWDSFIAGIRAREYMKNPINIYDENGDRIDKCQ